MFYLFPASTKKTRVDLCDICSKSTGNIVGAVNYFGLCESDVVQCPDCGLISIDPVPSEAIVTKGCELLYQTSQPSEDRKNIIRGFSKSYRRGAYFARRFLAQADNHTPLKILEVGAGDGYFSAGIKAELPQAQLWLMDIVETLVQFYKKHHDCNAVVGELNSSLLPQGSFDLIIFRDLLEHVRFPFQFLKQTHSLLKPKGEIFFITPNGREDFWMINQRFLKTETPTLMLLNHFHYFLPETLDRMLSECGFSKRVAFKFGLKQHRKGLGHREFNLFDLQALPTPSEAPSSPSLFSWQHDRAEITNSLFNNLSWLSKLYSRAVDQERKRIPFHSARGHEFFVIASKKI